MKTRGFSLLEVLGAIMLLGILSLITSLLIFPVLRAFARQAGSSEILQQVHRYLERMEDDIRSASPEGFNHEASSSDWTVSLVLREWDSFQAATSWSKSLTVYHFQASSQSLYRAQVASPEWPDGQPRLTGAVPLKLSAGLFSEPCRTNSPTPIASVVSSTWEHPQALLKITLQIHGGKQIELSRDFRGALLNP